MREKKLHEDCDNCHLNCYRRGVPKPASLKIIIHTFDGDYSFHLRSLAAPFQPCKVVTISLIMARLNELVAKYGDFEVVSISFDNLPF